MAVKDTTSATPTGRPSKRRTKAELNAIQEQVAERLRQQPTSFVYCRDPGIRHAWMIENDFHDIPITQVGRRLAMLGRDEVCARCNTVKRETFVVQKGGVIEKVSTSYDYPDGYQMAGVPRGVKRSTIIYQENYRRAMEAVANAAAGERETAEG